jgi:preprotein translocase subunit YajC
VEYLPIVAVALLFWLLLIRPASKRQKELSRMQSALRAGDEVMLGAGIFATVVAVDDDSARVHVEVAPGTTLQVARGAIAQVVDPAADPEVGPEVGPESRPESGSEARGEQGPRGDL